MKTSQTNLDNYIPFVWPRLTTAWNC